MNEINQLSNDVFFLQGAGAFVSFSNDARQDVGRVARAPGIDYDIDIKFWGSDNHTPNVRESILQDNNIVGGLMTTKRDIILGGGLYPYIEEMTGEGPAAKTVKIPILINSEIDNWMDESEFYDSCLYPACNEMLKHENIMVGMMPAKGGGIHSAKAYGCKNIRAVKKRKNIIPAYIHHGDWENTRNKEHKASLIPRYDPKSKKLGMVHFGDNFFNDGYYNRPVYWGGSEWLELSNVIPKFHKANLKNGYTIRYHIEYPNEYFMPVEYFSTTDEKTKRKCKKIATRKREAFLSKINEVLAGHENAGRTINSTKFFNALTKEYEGITITPIKADLQDTALLKLFDASNMANYTAQNIHSSLANVDSAGKLGTGSEIKNAFNLQVNIKTLSQRRQLLNIWKVILKANKWHDLQENGRPVKWGFKDIVLTNLDDDKSGVKEPVIAGQTQ